MEARCPTFLWSGVPGARGYELAVFVLSEEDGAEPELFTRVSVAGDARGFTPPSSDCLERGRRYAWSVAVTATGAMPDELHWSRPFLFEVEAAPSRDELEQAIATIERYRAQGLESDRTPALADHALEPPAGSSPPPPVRPRHPRAPFVDDDLFPGALTTPTTGVTRVASAATPALGNPSLRVSANVALSAASNLFKEGVVFLWDDTTGNTALGRNALATATGDTTNNTAVGRDALRFTTSEEPEAGFGNTAVGDGALRSNTEGSDNTAIGYRALFSNTDENRSTAIGGRALQSNAGFSNTASGYSALSSNTFGDLNTGSGFRALFSNTIGSRNTAVGANAGQLATTGSDNIFVGSGAFGVATEGNTIRIGGTVIGAGVSQQNRAFINGIRGITTGNANAGAVLIDSAGQLGTISSSRELKQDIQDLGSLADQLLELRPVAFRYKQHAANDPDTPLQFGLIAEEVAEVFPDLVVFDEDGKPETVKYHLLSALLLGEVQRLHDRLETVEDQARARPKRNAKRKHRPGKHG